VYLLKKELIFFEYNAVHLTIVTLYAKTCLVKPQILAKPRLKRVPKDFKLPETGFPKKLR